MMTISVDFSKNTAADDPGLISQYTVFLRENIPQNCRLIVQSCNFFYRQLADRCLEGYGMEYEKNQLQRGGPFRHIPDTERNSGTAVSCGISLPVSLHCRVHVSSNPQFLFRFDAGRADGVLRAGGGTVPVPSGNVRSAAGGMLLQLARSGAGYGIALHSLRIFHQRAWGAFHVVRVPAAAGADGGAGVGVGGTDQ